MNNYFKSILQLILIGGVEIAVILMFIKYVLPCILQMSPYKLDDLANFNSAVTIHSELDQIAVKDPPSFKVNNSDFSTFSLFLTEASQKKILAVLGEPTWQKPGYWENSVAWHYADISSFGIDQIDIGFLFDSQTKKLRQAEIALPPHIQLGNVYRILDSFLYFTPAEIEQKLESVYWRKTNHQEFKIG